MVNKLNVSIKESKIFYVLVLAFFFVGIILGTYTIKYMNSTDSMDVTNYFNTFLSNINESSIDTSTLLINILKKNVIIIGLIILFGFTMFGTPFILIIDLMKGFTIGYSFSFLLTVNGGEGLWLALASIIPQNIIYIPFFIGLSIFCMEISSTKLKQRFFNSIKINRIVTRDILIKLSFLIGFFIIGVLIETYLCPGIIRFVVTKVYKLA